MMRVPSRDVGLKDVEVHGDPAMCGRIEVAFLLDYYAKLAERLTPAGNVSNQISTVGAGTFSSDHTVADDATEIWNGKLCLVSD